MALIFVSYNKHRSMYDDEVLKFMRKKGTTPQGKHSNQRASWSSPPEPVKKIPGLAIARSATPELRTFPYSRSADAEKNYTRAVEKISKTLATLKKNSGGFYPEGNTKVYANAFKKQFYDDTSNLNALEKFVTDRKTILGEKLQGAGIPCVLFTTVQISNQEICLVSISGIKHFDANDPELKKTGIASHLNNFWNFMKAFFEKSSDPRYFFLGERSRNYDILLYSIAQEQLEETEKHKSCAEKTTFNFLQKIMDRYGENASILGSQAYRFGVTQSDFKEIPPCSTCKKHIPGVQAAIETANQLSPTRSRNDCATPRGDNQATKQLVTVKDSPLKTTPSKQLALLERMLSELQSPQAKVAQVIAPSRHNMPITPLHVIGKNSSRDNLKKGTMQGGFFTASLTKKAGVPAGGEVLETRQRKSINTNSLRK